MGPTNYDNSGKEPLLDAIDTCVSSVFCSPVETSSIYSLNRCVVQTTTVCAQPPVIEQTLGGT